MLYGIGALSSSYLKLSRLYRHIKAITFEAEWFRRIWEEYPSFTDAENIKKHHFVGKKLNKQETQIERLKQIRKEIDDVLKERCWTSQQVIAKNKRYISLR